MKNIKISVIIAIYNVEKYIEKCINSVIYQTYKNLEIICVDDGSTDRSGDICDNFKKLDNRITIIHRENGGKSSACNVALERCTGDFISFIDGDDWLEKNMYEILVNNITSSDIDISVCGYFKDYLDRCEIVSNEWTVPENPMAMKEFLKYIYIRDKYQGVASYLWNRIIRKSIFDKFNVRFRENMFVGEDVIITAECYVKTRKIVYSSTPLYHYIQRQSSVMHDCKKRLGNLGSCVAYQYIIELYQKNKVDNEIIDYVKRFFVYHSSILLKIAYECNDKEKIEILKGNIKKYYYEYCNTNKNNPERIKEIDNLLNENHF